MKDFRRPLFLLLLTLLTAARAQPLYKGLGITLRSGEGWYSHPIVQKVIPGSDAEKQGVKPDMTLWKVDVVDTLAMKVEDVTQALDTPVGSMLSVEVGAEDQRAVLRLTAVATRGRCLEGDCSDGEGVLAGVDGGVYRGHFVNGLLEGFGRVDFAGDNWYEGEFSGGVFSGKGRRVQGRWTFTGNWSQGLRAAGPGVLASTDGDTLSGEGTWEGGLTGKGVYELPDEHLCFESSFVNGWNLWNISGWALVRNLETNHCYEGNFKKADPEGEGVFIGADGSRTPFRPGDYRSLLRVLASPAGIAAAAPQAEPQRDWGLEADTEESTVQTSKSAPAEKVRQTVVECEPCGGTGFVVTRCSWCSGLGYTEQVFTRYHTSEGNSYLKSNYDNTGRYAGQSTVRDVTTKAEQSVLKRKCVSCDGRGFRVTSRRCATCSGKGKVLLITNSP